MADAATLKTLGRVFSILDKAMWLEVTNFFALLQDFFQLKLLCPKLAPFQRN